MSLIPLADFIVKSDTLISPFRADFSFKDKSISNFALILYLLKSENIICRGLRYDAKLVNNDGIDPEFTRNLLIENIEFKSLYASLLILMPLDVELPKVLSEIVEECNQYGNFLYDKPVLTNVKKLSDEEIVEFVRKQVLSKRQDRT